MQAASALAVPAPHQPSSQHSHSREWLHRLLQFLQRQMTGSSSQESPEVLLCFVPSVPTDPPLINNDELGLDPLSSIVMCQMVFLSQQQSGQIERNLAYGLTATQPIASLMKLMKSDFFPTMEVISC